jgi:hypothetical protein
MQPPDPNTPSGAPATGDAAGAAEPVSEPTEGISTESRNWFSRLFRRGVPDDEPQESEREPPASNALTLTQEELDRRVQAETDRRLYKRELEAKAAERRKLRDEDPYAYADLDRQTEQAVQADSQITTLFASIGSEHDKHTLDPLVQALPEAERARILQLEGAGAGLQGRKLIVDESLKALEKHWKAEGAKDAETRLRKNPAFRKQVLAEGRGQRPEPEYLPSGTGSEADHSISNILRQQLRSRHNGL